MTDIEQTVEAIENDLAKRYEIEWQSAKTDAGIFLVCDGLCININNASLRVLCKEIGATERQFDLNDPQSIQELYKWLDTKYSSKAIFSEPEITQFIVRCAFLSEL